jgi:hypothetical protein
MQKGHVDRMVGNLLIARKIMFKACFSLEQLSTTAIDVR